jgi:polysaccharide biosynthesis transport protein
MKRSRFNGLQDYLALLVRRRWWVIGTTLALAGLALLASALLPKIYMSETMILIQPRDIPGDFVKDLLAGSAEQRLSTIEQTVLSRTNLLKIVGEFEDRLPSYRNLNDERKTARLRKAIQVQFSADRRTGSVLPTTSYRISYRDHSPELAQKITARLAALFIEQDNQARAAQVSGAAEFFAGELKKVADQLTRSEARLKSLKEGNRFELPDDRDTSLRTLDRLQLQKNATLEALDRFRSLQMTLERQISETPQLVPQNNPPKSEAGKTPARNPLLDRYISKQQEYAEALSKKTPQHPDVLKLKGELDQLKKEIPPQELAATVPITGQEAPGLVANPVYQSLKDQLAQLKTDIELREKDKKNIEAEMARYNERIQNMPRVEQELAAAKRENSDLMKQHDDLKGKLEQARLSESLETRPRGSQFEIVDPANLPLDPITPKRSILALIGLIVSLAAGCAVAWIVDALNPRIWTQRELERFMNSSVLVEIPSMVTAADLRRKRRIRLAQALLSALLVLGYFGGLYYLYENQDMVVRLLNPVAEKLAERSTS